MPATEGTALKEVRSLVRDALVELLGRSYAESICGLRYRVLFYRSGYAPHFAEHVVDPMDGREKLVMADPHVRRSAIIYDTKSGEVEWEFEAPGSEISANPHIARMLLVDVPEIGARAGDVVMADRDNRFVLVDRDTKRVKWWFKPPDARWSHDMLLSKDGRHFVVTDYSAGFVRKVKFDGTTVWDVPIGRGAAKLSTVGGPTPSGIHSDSFGGDYLVAVNQATEGVYEIRDEDGVVVWSTAGRFPTFRPHSCFRVGLAELEGNLTVIGFEAGGGVVAVDRDGRPRFGFMRPYALGLWHRYRPGRFGFLETTHVFSTLRGGVGAIDWSGRWGSRVVEILGFPRAPLVFLQASEWDPGDSATYLEPPLDVLEFDEVIVTLVNEGPAPVTWRAKGCPTPYARPEIDRSPHWLDVRKDTDVPPGSADQLYLDNRRRRLSFLAVGAKRTVPGAPTRCTIVVAWR